MHDTIYISPILAAFFTITILATLNKLSVLALLAVVLVLVLTLLAFLLVNISIRFANYATIDLGVGARNWHLRIHTNEPPPPVATDWATNWTNNPDTITVVE